MAQVQVNFRASRQELAAIERARGDMPRNAWLREAVRAALAADGESVRPVSEKAPLGVRLAVPPEVSAFVSAPAEALAPIARQIDLLEAVSGEAAG